MPKFKADIICTCPVAIQKGSGFHIPNPRPWHMNVREVSCPDCDAVFVVDEGFSQEYLLNQLKDEHARNRNHPPYLASEPAFTRTRPCDCKDEMGCSFKGSSGETCGKTPAKTFSLYLDPQRFRPDGTVNPNAKNLSTTVELCAEHENGWDNGPGLVVRRFGRDLGIVRD